MVRKQIHAFCCNCEIPHFTFPHFAFPHPLYSFCLGRYKGFYLPLIYVLCCDKSQNTYEEIFKNILLLAPGVKPQNIMFDFERASMNAASICFNSAQISGCFFHFSQSVWRHIQSVGLQSKYSGDTKFAHNIRMLLALAFVRPCDVIAAYDQLIATTFWVDHEGEELNDEKQALLNYFVAACIDQIGRSTQTQQKRLLFAIKMWTNLEYANNNVEA